MHTEGIRTSRKITYSLNWIPESAKSDSNNLTKKGTVSLELLGNILPT